jgi:hypothetical protein
MKKQCCIMCRKPLKDGIIINGRTICKSCELKLIKTRITTDFYEYYKNCIKKNIVPFVLGGVKHKCQNYHL